MDSQKQVALRLHKLQWDLNIFELPCKIYLNVMSIVET